MKKLVSLSLLLSLLSFLYSQTLAEVPQMMNHQWKLGTADGGEVMIQIIPASQSFSVILPT